MTHVSDHIQGLSVLTARMHEQVKLLVEHSGEKGRSSEHVVRGLLRAILPKRFSLGTGLIVSADGETSRQSDIVIYDDFHNSSPSLAGDVGIFPVECVYAAIEVKSSIDIDGIRSSAEAIGRLRKMKKYYRVPTFRIDLENRTIETKNEVLQSSLAPRTYLFAFDTEYKSIDTLICNVRDSAAEHAAHFHGVLVLSKGWFLRQRPHVSPPAFKFCDSGGELHFARTY